MKPINRKTLDMSDQKPAGGDTRPPDAPLDADAAESYDAVEPALYGGNARWSLQAAVSDPDVEDSIGGE